ncbi:MAG: class I SAM-dependent methyltransferase [Cyanobacteriota bacterium ELA615]
MSKIMYPREFFTEQWQVYQKVLDFDYMSHQGIYHCLTAILKSYFNRPITMLELGCGDASYTAKALSGLNIASYYGIDISPVALENANNNLHSLGCQVVLVEADFNPLGQQLSQEYLNSFDCILISFALHHLNWVQKDKFLAEVYNFLKPENGQLIVIDVMRREQENDRDAYLDRYLAHMRQDWTQITPEEYLLLESHISSSDFPEKVEEMIELGYKNKFNKVECLYVDPLETMATLSFWRTS